MNTPKTRKPQRWKAETYPSPSEGSQYFGIANPNVGASFGFVVSYWWHLEEVMTYVLEDLLEGRRNETFSSHSAARNMFRTIVSQEARIKLMRSLLEGMPHNAEMPGIYDDILDEFASLNKVRNDLVHGSWITDASTGKVSLRFSSAVPNEMQPIRAITNEYLTGILARMRALHEKATLRGSPPISSRGTSLPTRNEHS